MAAAKAQNFPADGKFRMLDKPKQHWRSSATSAVRTVLSLMRRIDELHLEFPFASGRLFATCWLPRGARSAAGM